MKTVWLACGLALLLTHHAFAWGSIGHQAIAEAAQSALSRSASAQLAKIFGHGDALAPGALARASTWPDEIRTRNAGEVPPGWDASDTREADQFNADHKRNAAWHFVNLPLGAPAYPERTAPDDPVRAFTRDDDIVHVIRRCVRILESPDPPRSFTKIQAVRWLVHLVGDIHQPMHVTSGYYRVSGDLARPTLIRDPVAARGPDVVSDRGGNGLLFPSLNNVHAVWDGCLVDRMSGKACGESAGEYTPLARQLAARAATEGAAFRATGDHHGWPEQWATDSLRATVAADAYPTRLANGTIKTSRGGDERYLEATIISPTKDAYIATHATTAARQLLKAAVRLADLLNAIAWR